MQNKMMLSVEQNASQHESLENRVEYQSFLKNALAMKGSVTPKVMKNVGLTIIYASIVSYLCYLIPSLILPVGPFEYGGFIMGLILVFRVNTGYDRWWEARKLWGSVVNQCRNLATVMISYTHEDARDWAHKATNMVAALPYLMKDHLRGQTQLDYLRRFFDAETFQQLSEVKHRPVVLASMIAHELKIARDQYGLDSFAFHHAQDQIQRIIDAQGACERILKTPMPFVMAIKSKRFILFFLLMLPFALANVSLFISPLVAAIVSYALFSIDQIGLELQNPFCKLNLSHLPLDAICKTIDSNIAELNKIASASHALNHAALGNNVSEITLN